jgi:ferredoxin
MSLKIIDECINCDVCAPACPNDAIYQGEIIFQIDPARCTECFGHFNEPQCVAICPVNCIIPDPERQETPAMLALKLHNLQQNNN